MALPSMYVPTSADLSKLYPCGIDHKPVGSLAQFYPGISVEKVKPVVLSQFAEVFGVQMVEAS